VLQNLRPRYVTAARRTNPKSGIVHIVA
jgi:hypothetical protein